VEPRTIETESQFEFYGLYRVQSQRRSQPSGLKGVWLRPAPGHLDSHRINIALRRHPCWQGRALVQLRPALVWERSGAFATEGDALYYDHSFRPLAESAPFHTNILDVPKLLDHWSTRLPLLAEVFEPATLEALLARVGPVATTATDEYFCHEAGHATGWDVEDKYTRGYFRLPDGALAWPLVYTEEFRADLMSFGHAIGLLPPDRAGAVFTYHLLHRLGLAAQSRQGRGRAEAVPYLLFHLLSTLGVLSFHRCPNKSGRLSWPGLTTESVLEVMSRCSRHGHVQLTQFEGSGADPLDVAIQAATYFRERLVDEEIVSRYASLSQHRRSGME
jgi:hypothetical protein